MLSNWFRRRKETKGSSGVLTVEVPSITDVKVEVKGSGGGLEKLSIASSIPAGYHIHDLSQSILHMLWQCQLIHTEDMLNKVHKVRMVFAEEYDTPEEAVQACAKMVAEGKLTYYNTKTRKHEHPSA